MVQAEVVLLTAMPSQNCLCAVFLPREDSAVLPGFFLLLLDQGVTALVIVGDRELIEPKAQGQVSVYWNLNVVPGIPGSVSSGASWLSVMQYGQL